MKTIATLLLTSLLITFTSILTACGNSPSEPQLTKTDVPRVAKDKQSCLALNGEWKPQGRLQAYACVFTAKDAGQQCTDSSQCEYRCLLKPASDMPTAGSRASGQCQATSSPFGCKYEVLGGVVQQGLCID